MLGTNAIATVYLDVATAFKSNGDAETASALAARAQAMNPGAEIQASLARLTGQDPGRSVEADSEEDAQPSADDLRQQIDARIGAPQFLARDVAWSADRLAELEDLTGDSTAETGRVIERILLSSDQLVQEGRENDAVQLLVYSAATFAEATEFPERLNQIEGGAPPPIRELSTAERLAFNVDNLLEQPSLEGTVFTQLKASLRRLEREVGDNAPLFLETRSRVSNEYGERAKAFAAQGDAEKAEAYLQSATELDPTFADRVQIDTQGATGPAGWQNVAEARSAFDTAIAAGRVDEAAAIVQQLPAEMRSGDSFFQGEASLQIAEQYKQRALDAAESGDFETALDNIELGLEWSPEDATLIRWQSRYQRLTGATGPDAAAGSTTDE